MRHCRTAPDAPGELGGRNSNPQDSNSLFAEKGLSNYHAKHRDVLSVVYEHPMGAGRRFFSSAGPFTNRLLAGWQVAFISSFHSAGLNNFDISIDKSIPFGEEKYVQFRAEMFNVFSHTNFYEVDHSLGSSTFGQITSAHPSKEIQMGLKLVF